MKFLNLFYRVLPLLLLLLFIVMGVMGYMLLSLNNKVVKGEEEVNSQINNLLSIIENQKLLADALQSQISSEQKNREEAQAQSETIREALEKQVSTLQSNLSKQEEKTASTDISQAVSLWSPRVGRVTCTYGNPSVGSTKGSAVAVLRNGVYEFVTNAHVFKHDVLGIATKCTVILGEDTFVFAKEKEQIVPSASEDVGYFILNAPAPHVSAFKPLSLCSQNLSIGDSLLILGYPGIGSSESITATEGILSGIEGKYYISSAKIDRGNSGGAAIDIKNNCFAGIPTLITVGIESLARILSAKYVF